MNRSYPAKKAYNRSHPQELSKKTAIHEAGHAAAIYLGNKQKQLPPVFFQIIIKEPDNECPVQGRYGASHHHFAEVEGGRLIHTLPSSIEYVFLESSADERSAYLRAVEADIINLLVGPLAEAKYVALSDDEPINPRLVNLDSLHHYGGSSDLKTVREYLDCLLDDQAQKEKKVFELFLAAYDFINDPSNWNAITVLADYIVETGKRIIDCEEAIGILDAKKASPKKMGQ
ncbi:MAG: hypothetical protein HOP23_02050 [Methylococcaceae bacterium]|nr:hypothetical protein [Methylococcaceae bacterium]